MNNLVVIGAGTMGNGIAHAAAASGVDVTLIDVEGPILERAMNTISTNLQRGVDKGVMKLGMNHPMGPLQLADFIGLDVCLAILRVLDEGLGDPKYRPCPLLVKMVDAGWLGKKSGRGFYRYGK